MRNNPALLVLVAQPYSSNPPCIPLPSRTWLHLPPGFSAIQPQGYSHRFYHIKSSPQLLLHSHCATGHCSPGSCYPQPIPTTKQLPHPLNPNSNNLWLPQLDNHHIWDPSPSLFSSGREINFTVSPW